MSQDSGHETRQTVGSLLGLPLGATGDLPTPSEPLAPPAPSVPAALRITASEAPWTVADGQLGPPAGQEPFRANGAEALDYNNPFGQNVEQVWFNGKIVYAVDAGAVEIDPDLVKVAQEYQVVYAVDLDQQGKPKSEPERVPDQLNIYDSVPGMEQYSPIWQFNYVVVPPDYPPNRLRSEADCLNSGYPIVQSQVFEN